MRRRHHSPLGAVARGLAAGVVGTAVMTAAQTAYYKANDMEGSSTPGEVAKRITEGVLQREFPDERMQTATSAMHWLYGTSWGVPYGLWAGTVHPGVLRGMLAATLMVWGAAQVQLPAMKLAPPPWKYSPSSLATDVGFHSTWAAGTALAYRALS
jgi:uncharacterized membrane protein YagU involved in acid resistance